MPSDAPPPQRLISLVSSTHSIIHDHAAATGVASTGRRRTGTAVGLVVQPAASSPARSSPRRSVGGRRRASGALRQSVGGGAGGLTADDHALVQCHIVVCEALQVGARLVVCIPRMCHHSTYAYCECSSSCNCGRRLRSRTASPRFTQRFARATAAGYA